MTNDTRYLAVHTENAIFGDAEAHTLTEWRDILKGMSAKFQNVFPFHATEENYEEEAV